jgi:signal transduction histidine kinase
VSLSAHLQSKPVEPGARAETSPLRVLLVEDNAADARLLREMFSKEAPGRFELSHLTHMHEAEAKLSRGEVDIVLLDMGLPDGHGLETLRRARAADPNVVMIVMTGLEDDELADLAMKEGAQDYLIKGQVENRALPRALRYAVERQRMQIEADIMRNQQVQMRDEFLSHVSHELRSPLTSIYSFSTIIADGLAGPISSQQDEYLQIVLRNVRQLKSMIDDLLEVTQAQAGKLILELGSVSINEALEYAVHTLRGSATEKEIHLSCSVDKPLSAYADETRVRQILTILIDNAIKFTPAGGSVRAEAQPWEKDPNMLLLEVQDTGCGIPAESIGRVFEHLYQVTDSVRAGRKGLGLGLHIAKDLVTRQGGEIWASSEVGIGSRFSFTLPRFSLAALLKPILSHQSKPGEAIAIISIGIEYRDGSPDLPKDVLEKARVVLQRCLRPESDVLLPTIGAAGEHKLFFAVAYTRAGGAEIIADRILSQLRQHLAEQLSDLALSASHSFLPPLSPQEDEDSEAFAERVAVLVREQIYKTRIGDSKNE